MYSFMKQGGLEVKLRTFLTVPVLSSHFTVLATLIADKHAPGTQTIIDGPPNFVVKQKILPMSRVNPHSSDSQLTRQIFFYETF
jgi:hypothetical protein